MENSIYEKFKALADKKRLTVDDKETIATAAATTPTTGCWDDYER